MGKALNRPCQASPLEWNYNVHGHVADGSRIRTGLETRWWTSLSFSKGDWAMSWITALTASALLTSSYEAGDKERVFRFATENLGKDPPHRKRSPPNKRQP